MLLVYEHILVLSVLKKVHSVVVSCIDSTENVVREFILSLPSSNKSITILSDNNFIGNSSFTDN